MICVYFTNSVENAEIARFPPNTAYNILMCSEKKKNVQFQLDACSCIQLKMHANKLNAETANIDFIHFIIRIPWMTHTHTHIIYVSDVSDLFHLIYSTIEGLYPQPHATDILCSVHTKFLFACIFIRFVVSHLSVSFACV